jgi:hypothetical protein
MVISCGCNGIRLDCFMGIRWDVFTPSGEGQDMDSWESSSFSLLGGFLYMNCIFFQKQLGISSLNLIFPETVGNGKSSQLTNSLHDFLEWGRLKPPTRNGCCLENHLHMEMFSSKFGMFKNYRCSIMVSHVQII